MRVLLDHCVDIRFRELLEGHEVVHTKELGWEQLSNGKLLAAAEAGLYQVFITVDKNLRHQQNVEKCGLAVITLASRLTALDDIRSLAPEVQRLLDQGTRPGVAYVVVDEGKP